MLNLYAFGFGAPIEWIFVAGVALLLLGPKKLPEFARGLGKSIGELKKGLDETKETFNASIAAPEPAVEAKPVLPGTEVQSTPVATVTSTTAK